MSPEKQLDMQALESAKHYMGDVAWPTVAFGLTVFVAYLATPALVVTGHLPLLVAAVLMAVLTYLGYTVLHEAAHGSISGSHNELRWLNELMGYLGAWMLMIPLTAHRHEHLAHHRHTNDPDMDPDYTVSQFRRTPWRAPSLALAVMKEQFGYYFRNRWSRGPRRQDVTLCLEVAAILIPRLAFMAAGFWVEGLVLFGLAWIAGLTILLFLFAYIVHAPYDAEGRFVDTATILVPDNALGKLITAAWVYQNYHSIHHLFPRVPFYRYPALLDDIQDTMLARGAPFYRLGWRGLQRGERNAVEVFS